MANAKQADANSKEADVNTKENDDNHEKKKGSVGEVFTAFLSLGLTSFGGPIAHLGYFQNAFVEKRQWLSEKAYAELIALCQFLPGPASSQVGMAIGLHRAGIKGLFAAWLGFTMPSAILLTLFSLSITNMQILATDGWIKGLKAAAVAVVAHALISMATQLTPDTKRATIAAISMIAMLLIPGPLSQILVIIAGGLIGLLFLQSTGSMETKKRNTNDNPLNIEVGRNLALLFLSLFVLLLTLPLVITTIWPHHGLDVFSGFYRTGALVFGGGHVVLPLLEAETVGAGHISQDIFLAGYGAAQAIPGPLFTFAAYLGAAMNTPPNGIVGASLALIAIFLPSALLLLAILPFWANLRKAPRIQSTLTGINASVVGLLGAALYNPVFIKGITSPFTMSIAVASYLALAKWRLPAWLVVFTSALLGFVLL